MLTSNRERRGYLIHIHQRGPRRQLTWQLLQVRASGESYRATPLSAGCAGSSPRLPSAAWSPAVAAFGPAAALGWPAGQLPKVQGTLSSQGRTEEENSTCVLTAQCTWAPTVICRRWVMRHRRQVYSLPPGLVCVHLTENIDQHSSTF